MLVPAFCIAAGALCLGVIAATSARGGAAPFAHGVPASASSSSPSPSPSPSASPGASETLTTTVVRAVTVHSGSVARVRYRADDTAGGTVTIDLLVTTRAGEVRRRLVTGRVAAVGVER